MGDKNQSIFAENVFKQNKFQNILEIGSKNYGNTEPFRKILNYDKYIGVDLSEGDGVDLVVNLEDGLGPLENKKFDLIIMCSIIEHSKRPWNLAENICSIFSEHGVLYSAHPWVWRYHKYPDDYFRFSPQGIKEIFHPLQFWLDPLYATNKQGDFYSFAKNEEIDNHLSIIHPQTNVKYLPYLQTLMVGTNSKRMFEKLKKENPEL
jgi:SAM-dependent methyltransferase